VLRSGESAVAYERQAGNSAKPARELLTLVQGQLSARHLWQHEDGGEDGLPWQRSALKSSLPWLSEAVQAACGSGWQIIDQAKAANHQRSCQWQR